MPAWSPHSLWLSPRRLTGEASSRISKPSPWRSRAAMAASSELFSWKTMALMTGYSGADSWRSMPEVDPLAPDELHDGESDPLREEALWPVPGSSG